VEKIQSGQGGQGRDIARFQLLLDLLEDLLIPVFLEEQLLGLVPFLGRPVSQAGLAGLVQFLVL
jgi:hypothetical protein